MIVMEPRVSASLFFIDSFIPAPVGRRGWKMLFARLRGLVIYLSRDEGDIKANK